MIIIDVKVTPNSKTEEVSEYVDLFGKKTYKVKTSKPPENGKANQSVLALIARHFNVKIKNVSILKGFKSSLKQIKVIL